jgi:microcystin-dependent protein
MTSVMRKTSAFMAHQKPTVGDTKTSFVSDDHLGWLRCDGRPLPVADFGILFGVIGYTFGGSGANFNLPNAEGRVVGTSGSGVGLTTRATGDLVGTETHQLTIAEMPAHAHGGLTGVSGEHTHTSNSTSSLGLMTTNGLDTMDASVNAGNEPNLYTPSVQLVINSNGNHQHTIASEGGNLPHNNMQPTIFMGNLFIYSGIPPYGVWPYTTGSNIN